MFQNTFARFKAKIESVKTAVPLFEFIDHHQTLQIVFKAAVFAHACVERVLPGMAERRMTEIVRERNRFDERFIHAQIARDRTRNLRHFQAMREPGPEQIAFMIDKNLRFAFQPSERSAMNTATDAPLQARLNQADQNIPVSWVRVLMTVGTGDFRAKCSKLLILCLKNCPICAKNTRALPSLKPKSMQTPCVNSNVGSRRRSRRGLLNRT